MLYKAKTLKGYHLHSLDGDIGKIEEFYFDDQHWTIRYLITDTGNWLTGRQVLISPYALGTVNKEEHYISVNLTKEQIENSPSLNQDEPVSRQFEESYYKHFGWPVYWGGVYNWGTYPYIVLDPKKWDSTFKHKKWDHNLRSTHDVSGHNIQAIDGEIGHVDDFIIDDKTWAIHYLVVDTQNWRPGKKVLISPLWIDRISFNESKVFVDLLRETIMQSPVYTDDSLLIREYEIVLHQHYNRQGYWVND